MIKKIQISEPVLYAIGSIADEEGIHAYVVGGHVRDMLLGKEGKDIDVMVIGNSLAFAARVTRELHARSFVEYGQFHTAMMEVGDYKIEFVASRKESYAADSRKPSVDIGTLEEDLARRDFTINALAASLNKDRLGEITDLFEGIQDLKKKILRTPLEPQATFSDDPLRMMRACRFAAQLEFELEDAAYEAIVAMRERISIVSKERISDEFLKTLRVPRPSIGLELMYETGLMEIIFPEVARLGGVELVQVSAGNGVKEYAHKDVFYHTMKVLDNISEVTENVWLRFAALVHDIAKPKTKIFREGIGWTFYAHEEVGARWMKKIFQRMKLPNDKAEYVAKLVRLHQRPMVLVKEEVTDSAIRRILFEAGDAIDDLMMLCRADITTKNPRLSQRYLRNYDVVMEKMKIVEEKDRMRAFQSPVRGEEIMATLGLPPSKRIGNIKHAIEEAILEGIIPNEHDAAFEYMMKIAKDM